MLTRTELTWIELIRRKKNFSQKELAKRIGEIASNLSQIECGYRKPWPKVRKTIAEALECSEDDLFGQDGFPLVVNVEMPAKKEAI